jgi:hypothetical protein
MKWTEYVERMTKMRNAYTVLVGKFETKRPIGRTKGMSEDNIKVNVKQTECGLDSSGSG